MSLARRALACVAIGMELAETRSPFEAAAKAALLNFFRDRGMLKDAVIVSELELPSAGRRADLALISEQAVAIEIKTKADSLSRLSEQLGTFCQAFPAAYAAVASTHLKRTWAIAPKECGVIELRDTSRGLEVRVHRQPKPFRTTTSAKQASLLPARELGRILRTLGISVASNTRRSDLAELVVPIDAKALSPLVTQYLRTKYGSSSARFSASTSGRPINVDDLRHLRLWEAHTRGAPRVAVDPDSAFFSWLTSQATEHPLGQVPEDIAARFAA